MTAGSLAGRQSPREVEPSAPLEISATKHELSALLLALQRAGVSLEDVRFDSRDPEEVGGSREGSRIRLGSSGRLVRGLYWDESGARRRATVHLDLGLFSASSPLPSYFHRLLEERGLGENLALLLRVLDHGMLMARARGESREYLRGYPWEARLREVLVNGSPRYLDGLFRRVFPELRVEVTWQMVPRSLGIDRAALGSATLGSCAFDGRGLVLRRGLEVTLTALEDLEGSGVLEEIVPEPRGWVQEAKRRLGRQILPQFRARPVALVVRLRILSGRDDARVDLARVGEDAVPTAGAPFGVTLFEGLAGK